MTHSKLRGHTIYFDDSEWKYLDGSSVKDNFQSRGCGYCGKDNTEEGHDGCLGTLKGVMNACCGHGSVLDAYVMFDNGDIIRGVEAMSYIKGEIK